MGKHFDIGYFKKPVKGYKGKHIHNRNCHFPGFYRSGSFSIYKGIERYTGGSRGGSTDGTHIYGGKMVFEKK